MTRMSYLQGLEHPIVKSPMVSHLCNTRPHALTMTRLSYLQGVQHCTGANSLVGSHRGPIWGPSAYAAQLAKSGHRGRGRILGGQCKNLSGHPPPLGGALQGASRAPHTPRAL